MNQSISQACVPPTRPFLQLAVVDFFNRFQRLLSKATVYRADDRDVTSLLPEDAERSDHLSIKVMPDAQADREEEMAIKRRSKVLGSERLPVTCTCLATTAIAAGFGMLSIAGWVGAGQSTAKQIYCSCAPVA